MLGVALLDSELSVQILSGVLGRDILIQGAQVLGLNQRVQDPRITTDGHRQWGERGVGERQAT